MRATFALPSSAGLGAYAENLSLSHRDWLVTLRAPDAAGPSIEGQPLRRMRLEGDDLVLEYGAAPGRPQRLRLAGPLAFDPHRTGLELEVRLDGPLGSHRSLVLKPPASG